MVDEIDDLALMLSHDSGVRFLGEVPHRGGMPVVAPGQPGRLVHSLLHYGPLAFTGENEGMEIDLKTILDRVVIDSRRQTACANESFAVETATIRNGA